MENQQRHITKMAESRQVEALWMKKGKERSKVASNARITEILERTQATITPGE